MLAGADLRGNLLLWKLRARGVDGVALLVVVSAAELAAAAAAVGGHARPSTDTSSSAPSSSSSSSAPLVASLAWWTNDTLVVSRANGDLFALAVVVDAAEKRATVRVVSSVERLRYAASLAIAPGTMREFFRRLFRHLADAGADLAPLLALEREPTANIAQHAALVDVAPDASRMRVRHRVVALRRIAAPRLLQRLLATHQLRRCVDVLCGFDRHRSVLCRFDVAMSLAKRRRLSLDAVRAAQFAADVVSPRSIELFLVCNDSLFFR